MSSTSWETKKLSEVADLCLGKMLDQKKNKGEYYPYLANLNVRWGAIEIEDLRKMRFEKKEFERYGLKYGDIVMCEGGEPGRCAIWKNQAPSMMIQKALHRIRAKEKIDSLFLFYALLNKGLQGHYDGYFTGAAIKHLTGEKLAQVEVTLPQYSTQRKIAAVIEVYDDLIENNLKRIKLLEEMAHITYEEWFVRMKYPGHETAIFDEETGLPKSWTKNKISDIGAVITGKTPSTSNEDFYGSDVPFIKTPDIAKAPYVINTDQSLSKLGADSQLNKYLPKNSLVVSCIGTAGEFGFVSEPSQTNQQINAIKFNKDSFVFYMYCFAKHLKPLLEALGSNGATMTNVNKSKFEGIDVVIPNEDLLQDFNELTKNSFESILTLQKKNKLLKEARDILLPRLMSGMIDIEQIELPEAILKQRE